MNTQNPMLNTSFSGTAAGGMMMQTSYHSPSSRERMGGFLLRYYDKLGSLEHSFHSRPLIVRLLAFPVILLIYCSMMFFMVGIILHTPPAQVFAHFQSLDPNRGYTVSFSRFQRQQFLTQVLIISFVVIFVCAFYYLFAIPAFGLYQL